MKLFRLKRFWLVLLAPLSALLLWVASRFPEGTERFYTRGLYRVLSAVGGRMVSLLPFSLTELILVALLLSVVFFLGLYIKNLLLRSRRVFLDRSKRQVHKWVGNLCAAAGLLVFAFALTCGPNYHRLTFAQQSGLEVRPSSTEELAGMCARLIGEVNALREELPEDEAGVMRIEQSWRTLAREAQLLYPAVAEVYPQLAGYAPRPKAVLFSRVMSYLDIGGIYIPFFFEPNVNVDVVDFHIPATMMHEMSHFKGYMREDEANFLAYLACKHSGDELFRYSGFMLAMRNSMNALYAANRELYYALWEQLSPKVQADLDANSAYWRQFAGPVAVVSTAVNDVYLRTNNQQSGVKSYGEMVDLLLAEYRMELVD